MSKYTCPSCGRGFDKTERGHCPHCEVKLKLERGYDHDAKKFSHKYVLPGQPEEQLPRTLTEPNENPEVQLTKTEPNHYIVTYRNIMHTTWVYCPECQGRMFENRVIQGNFSQEHKCRRCKAIVEFVFTTT